ncbi:nuclear transport factor 2 family protein [Roseateles sp. NT4]|uniref:nuclear transport factor 2 family protein n=1 Tax=Roseateles sp. NT4 TaxID=3453715 RepID=UPI003EEC9A02
MSLATRDLVLLHWRLANVQDWDGLGRLLHAEMTYEAPQSRERIRSPLGYVDFFATWPQPWRAEVLRCIADGSSAMTQISFISSAPPMMGLSLFDLKDGLIVKVTDYWPDPYEPGPRLSKHVERY